MLKAISYFNLFRHTERVSLDIIIYFNFTCYIVTKCISFYVQVVRTWFIVFVFIFRIGAVFHSCMWCRYVLVNQEIIIVLSPGYGWVLDAKMWVLQEEFSISSRVTGSLCRLWIFVIPFCNLFLVRWKVLPVICLDGKVW